MFCPAGLEASREQEWPPASLSTSDYTTDKRKPPRAPTPTHGNLDDHHHRRVQVHGFRPWPPGRQLLPGTKRLAGQVPGGELPQSAIALSNACSYLCHQVNVNQSEHKWIRCEMAALNSGLCGRRAHRWSFLFKWNVLAPASVKSFPLFPSGFSTGAHTWENGKRKLRWRAKPLEKLKWLTAYPLNLQRLKRSAQGMLPHCF